jgi:CRISPR-associated endonuclease Csn1
MKLWLTHRNVITRMELDLPGHPAPFLLAAAALQGHKTLSAFELWTVLRWYAHNRGYDGNSLWSRDDANDDDTEKETNAKKIMADHGTSTMAETVCACLGLKPSDHATRISSALPYKTLNAAYPREIVYQEVGKILCKHTGIIPNLDTETVRFLLKNSELTTEERGKLSSAGIKLPRRYHGGLLFGQLVPRFDNRIISRCPITWAETYDAAIAEGKTDTEARKLAEKLAKVPAAKSVEFLEYRFARILANLRAGGQPIAKELRHTLLEIARKQGRLTAKDLNRELGSYYGKAKTNVADYFTLHPDSENALVLDPVADEVRKAEDSRAKLSPIWKLLGEGTRAQIVAKWTKGKVVSLAEIIHINGDRDSLTAALEPAYTKANKSKQGKTKYADIDQYLRQTTIGPELPSGRAPYARPVLKRVRDEVLEGFDPTRSAKDDVDSKGNRKTKDGVLYPLGIKGSRVRTLQDERPLDQLTNNHLVRHRLLILDRLIDDIAQEFLTDGKQVNQVVVEVARELKEFSGKDSQAIKSALREKLKNFNSTIAYLEEHAPDLELNGSLIRKARIAMDMGWRCPFTGEQYEPTTLKHLERAHIIPYASRNTNALHALVLTRPEINSKQGKRTCRQFIMDEEANRKSGVSNLDLFTLKQYEDFVNGLKVSGHDDDRRRQRARKALLLTTDMDDKDLGFTDGNLTQTSHLAKLAMRGLTQRFPAAAIDPIPGPVTAELRKAWDLTGTLSLVCPEALDSEGKVRPKAEIRSLTHMHHALDAATIALAAHYFPLRKHGEDQKGKLWRALLKRNRTPEEQALLKKTGLFKAYPKTRHDHEGNPLECRTELKLEDLPASLKQSLRLSLAEARVMQHIPADRSGAKAELTTWGVVSMEGEGDNARISLRQNATTVENGLRKYDPKTREERAGKLLGPNPKGGNGKLAAIKGAMIIGENYGLALDPTPAVIPFHDVQARLVELRNANGGKPMRNGMLIKSKLLGDSSVWQIRSIKQSKRDGILLDLASPFMVPTQAAGKIWSKRDASIRALLGAGIQILPQRYTGHALKD